MSANARLQIIIDAQDQSRAAFSSLDSSLKGLGSNGKTASAALGSVSSDAARTGTALAGVNTGTTTAAASLGSLGGTLGQVGGAFGSMASQVAAAGVAVGGGLVAGIGLAVKSAADLQQAVANISTIKPDIDTSQVTTAIEQMSTRVAQSSGQLADSLYNIFSSVDVSQAQALQLTEEFGRGAVAAQTDAETFGTSILGVMNAYGQSVDQAAHDSDVFFNTVNKGVVTGDELAHGLGDVTQAAKNAGVNFDTLGALIAGVTKEGGSASTNINNLSNLLQKIATAPVQQGFADLGVVTKNADGSFRDIIPVLTDLKAKLDGLSESERAAALQKLFPDNQARAGIQTLLSQLDTVTSVAKDNATAIGVASDAYAKMGATASSSATILKNTAIAALQDFGTRLLPTATKAMQELSAGLASLAQNTAVQSAFDRFGTVIDGLFAKVNDPTFQNGIKQWGMALLDVGKSVADVAQGIGNVLGPVVEAAGLLFGALDDSGRRDVAMFGLVAVAALQFRGELGTLASALGPAATAVGELAARLGALLVSEEGITASSLSATFALGGLGTAAGVVGALLVPLAVFAGNVANDMHEADTGIQNVAKSLSGDLAPAIAKIQATNWESALVATFTGHAQAADDANKAVHAWAQGLDGAAPSLEEINKQIDLNTNALQFNVGMSDAERAIRNQVGKALYEEAQARAAANAQADAWIAYLQEEQGASDDAAYAARQHTNALAVAAQGYAEVTAEAQAFGAVVRTTDPAVQRLIQGFYDVWKAQSAAAASSPELGQGIDQVTNAWLIQTYAAQRASTAFAAMLRDQQGAAQQASVYSGQLGLLEGGLDRLNTALQSGFPLSAAQNIAYDQAAHAAAFYQVMLGELTEAQFSSALAAQQQVAAGLDAVHQAAVLAGASNDVAASLQNQAGHYLDLVAAVESANSAFRAASQAHSELGGEISDFSGRIDALTQQEKDYAAGKAGVTKLTADEAAQLEQLKGVLPGLQEAYRAQAVQVTNLEVAHVLANAAVVESQRAFQGQNQTVVASGVALADAALKAGTLTQAQHDLAVSAITSAGNAFDLTAAINSIPGQHVTKFVVDAQGAIETVDQYGKHLFDVPPQYVTKMQNNSSDLIPLVNAYGDTFLHVPADWVTHINNNAGEETPVIDQYGRTVAQIPKEWATSYETNAGELIPVVDSYGNIVKLVPRGQQVTDFIANTAGASLDTKTFAQEVIRLTTDPHVISFTTKFDFVNKYDEFGQLMSGAGGASNSITIPVALDTSSATATLATFKTDLTGLGTTTSTPTIALADNASPTLNTAKESLRVFGTTTATATAALLDNASGPLGGLIGEINSVPRVIGITASVDISGALGAIQTLRDNMPHSPAKEGPFRQLPDWTTVFDTFGEGVTRSIAELPRLSAAVDAEQADLEKKIADAASGVAKAIQDSLAAMKSLSSFDFAANTPSATQTSGLLAFVANTAAQFAEVGAQFKDTALKAASDFADTSGKVLGLFASGVAAIKSLKDLAPLAFADVHAFATDVGMIVQEFAWVAAQLQSPATSAAASFSDDAGKVLALIGNGVKALADLASGPIKDVPFQNVQAFATNIASIVQEIGWVATFFASDGLAAASAWADTAGKVIGIVTNGIAALLALPTVVDPGFQAIHTFATSVAAVVQEIQNTASAFTADGLAAATSFATGAGTVVGIIGNAVEGLSKLATFVAPSQTAIDNFVYAVYETVRKIGEMASQMSKEGITQAGAFGVAAGSIMAALKDALDIFTGLAKLVVPSSTAIDNFGIAVAYTVQKIGTLADQVGKDGIKKAQDFGTSITGIFGALKSATDILTGLEKFKDLAKKGMDSFFAGVQESVTVMAQSASAAGDFLTQAQAYHDLIEMAVSTVKQAQQALNTIGGIGGTPDLHQLGQGIGNSITDGAKDALDSHSPSQVMAQIGRDVVSGLVQGMTQDQQDAAKAAADLASSVAKAVTDTLDAMTALGGLKLSALPSGAQVSGLLDFTRQLVGAAQQAAAGITTDALTAASAWADGASKIVGLFSSGVDAIGKLANYVAPASSALYDVGKQIRAAVNDLAVIAEQVGPEMLALATGFTDGAGAVSDAVGKGADAFTKLAGYVEPAAKAIYYLDKQILAAVWDFAIMAQQIPAEMVGPAATFADAAGKVVDTVGKGVAAFASLAGFTYTDAIRLGILRLDQAIMAASTDFSVAVDKLGADTLRQAGTFATLAGEIVGLLSNGATAFKGIDDFVRPTAASLSAFVSATYDLVKQVASLAANVAPALLTSAAQWSDTAGKAVGLLSNGAKGFADLASFVAPTAGLVNAFVLAVADLTKRIVAMGAGEGADLLTAAGLWADTAGKALGLLANGVAGFAALKDYTSTPLAAMQSFVADTAALTALLVAAAQGFATDGLTAASGFADTASKALGLLGSVANFKGLADFVVPATANLSAFVNSTRDLVRRIADAAKTFAADGLTAAGQFADAGSKAIGLLGNGIGGFKDLFSFKAPDPQISARFVQAVRDLVAQIGAVAGFLSEEGATQANRFSDAAGKALGALSSGVSLFNAFDNLQFPSPQQLDTAMGLLDQMVRWTADAANVLGQDVLDQATAFGVAAAAVVSGLRGAVDLGANIQDSGANLTNWLRPMIDGVNAMLEQGAALLAKAQTLEGIAQQFAATMASAAGSFALGAGLSGAGVGYAVSIAPPLPGNLTTGGYGGGAVVNNYYVSGNTMLGRDDQVAAQLARAVTPAQSRTIGYLR